MAEPSFVDNNDDSNDSQAATFGDSPDVIFIFPNNGGATVSVQKLILMNSSEVFKKQFSFSSSGNEEPIRIAITDITFDTFKQLMSHIFEFDGDENNIDIYEDNYLELLYASRKYFVNDLTLQIIRFIIEFINENNLSEHFEFIEKFDIKMLNDHMRKICIRSPLKIIRCLSTSEPHKRILKMILESSRLPCTEYGLYQAVKLMFEGEKNDRVFDNEIFRKELGSLIYLIRFPLMTVTELISCGIKSSPLTAEELLDLLLFVQEGIFSNTIQFFSRESRQDETPKFCRHCRKFEEVCHRCKKAY